MTSIYVKLKVKVQNLGRSLFRVTVLAYMQANNVWHSEQWQGYHHIYG